MIYTTETYHDKIQKLLPESNFILKNFSGTEKPCEVKCLTCGEETHYSEAHFITRRSLRGNKNACKNCENTNHNKIHKTTQEIGDSLLQEAQIIPIDDTPIRWSSKANRKWKCLKCGNIFERAPSIFYYRNAWKCPWCESRAFKYSEDMIEYKIFQKWGNEYSYIKDSSKSEKGKRRIKVKHNTCGFIWEVDFYHFCLEGTGCPRCRGSRGERKVFKYLTKRNIPFIQQKAIKINEKRYLRFDFFIEDKNIAIEYNGIQHYQPIGYFGGEEGFLKQKERDEEKAKYCEENNINLIVIPYYDESLLQTELLAQRLGGQVPED